VHGKQRRVATILATAGYVGYAPVAPGTFGSAVGLVIYAAVSAAHSPLIEGLVIAAVLIAGLWSAGCVEDECGKDPGIVVIDEVLGMLVTLAFLDVTIIGAIVGFVVFRVLDVVKPFPAGRLEHLHGGAGIMLDDLMAGIYANIVLRVLSAALPATLA
jgi:phosphatidylglycerophosphatase A